MPLRGLFTRTFAFDSVKGVLKRLVEDRLVRLTGRDGIDANQIVEELEEQRIPDDIKVEVAHEALVRNWPKFVDWLSEKRASIITRRRLEAKAREWVGLDGAGGLLDDVQLREATQWMESPEALDLGYSRDLVDLVAESRKALESARLEKEEHDKLQSLLVAVEERANAERLRADEKARANKRLRQRLVIAVIASAFAIIAAAYAWNRSNVAEDRLLLAISSQLAARSLLFLDKNLDLSLLLSVEAVSISSKNPEALASLVEGLEYAPNLQSLLHEHNSTVTGITFLEDQRLASIDTSGTVVFWGDNQARERKSLSTRPVSRRTRIRSP